MILRVGVIVAWLVLTLGVVAVAAESWAVYETINGKTRVWRQGATDGSPGAIKKTEGECSTMLQLAQWSHGDDVARANRGADLARTGADWTVGQVRVQAIPMKVPSALSLGLTSPQVVLARTDEIIQ